MNGSSLGIGFSPKKYFANSIRNREFRSPAEDFNRSVFLEEAPDDSIQFKNGLDFLPSYYNSSKFPSDLSKTDSFVSNKEQAQALRLIKKRDLRVEEQKALLNPAVQPSNEKAFEIEVESMNPEKCYNPSETLRESVDNRKTSQESSHSIPVRRLLDFGEGPQEADMPIESENPKKIIRYEFKNTQSQRPSGDKGPSRGFVQRQDTVRQGNNPNKGKQKDIGSQITKNNFKPKKRKYPNEQTQISQANRRLKTNGHPLPSFRQTASGFNDQQNRAKKIEIDDEIESDDNFDNVNKNFNERMIITPLNTHLRRSPSESESSYSKSPITNNNVAPLYNSKFNNKKRLSDYMPMMEIVTEEEPKSPLKIIFHVEKIKRSFGLISLEGKVSENNPASILNKGENIVGIYSTVENPSSNVQIRPNSKVIVEANLSSALEFKNLEKKILFIKKFLEV